MKVISFLNEKGGVTKTTSTFNIGFCLAEKGYNVLMIDLDYQGSLGLACGIETRQVKSTIADVIKNDSWGKGKSIHQLRENLFICPANRDLKRVFKEIEYKESKDPRKIYFHLKSVLGKLNQDIMDFCLIDCHPDFDVCEINALCASDGIIIPCAPDYLPYRGANDFIGEAIFDIKRTLNPDLKELGILVSRYKKISTDDRVIMKQLNKQFGVIGIIPETVDNKRGNVKGKCTCEIKPKSVIAQEYRAITERIIERMK